MRGERADGGDGGVWNVGLEWVAWEDGLCADFLQTRLWFGFEGVGVEGAERTGQEGEASRRVDGPGASGLLLSCRDINQGLRTFGDFEFWKKKDKIEKKMTNEQKFSYFRG